MKKWFLVILILLIVITSLGSLFSKKADISKSKTFAGKFVKIETEVYKHDTSYNIWLNNYNNYFKVGASYSRCFDFNNFILMVSPGDTLIIKKESLDLLATSDVISVSTNHYQFSSIDCINTGINFSKNFAALMLVFLSLGLISYKLLKD